MKVKLFLATLVTGIFTMQAKANGCIIPLKKMLL